MIRETFGFSALSALAALSSVMSAPRVVIETADGPIHRRRRFKQNQRKQRKAGRK